MAHSWLRFRLTFWQIRFSRKVFNLRSSNFTNAFFRVSQQLSCGAMFFSVGSQFFVKCIFWRKVFFLYLFFTNFCVTIIIFHNSKTIQGIWMDLYRDVDPDDQARCTQVA